jgi:RimJ/RimL family protein N-acetyltransferase
MADDVRLREVQDGDLPILFEHQLDPDANRMAAFTVADPSDHAAFVARWLRIRADKSGTVRTIVAGGAVAGSVLLGSRRVLEKCGFELRSEEIAFATGRGEEVAEVLLELR